MGVLAAVVAGVVALVGALGALAFALRTATSAGRLRAAAGAPSAIAGVSGETEGFFAATVRGAPGEPRYLATVTDRFGYWCLRYWAGGASTNLFTYVGRVLVRLRYGDGEVRDDGGRRRAAVVVPDPLPVRSDGERAELALSGTGRPLQRLEVDGGLVPFAVVGPALFLGVVAALLLPVTLLFGPVLVAWVAATPAVQAALAGYLLLVVGLKGYHDTAAVGGWETVAGPEEDVPGAVAAAADTDDPAGTAQACLRSLGDGETVRVLGRVEPAGDGTVRVTEGVVTTRGRGFLAAAALAGVGRYLAWTLGLLAVAAGAGWVAWAAL